MNSFPTELNPWYVVSRFLTLGHLGVQHYYTTQDGEVEDVWTENQKKAMLFMSLSGAIRVAKSLHGQIIVVWDKGQLPDFGRDVGR